MQFSPASSFLLPCLCSDQGPSPWTDKPVLSTIKCTGFPDDGLFLMRISSVLVLLDRVVWSGIGNASFINWKMDVIKPSVYRSGRWNNSRMESIISIARSEYFCWPPHFFLEITQRAKHRPKLSKRIANSSPLFPYLKSIHPNHFGFVAWIKFHTRYLLIF